MTRTTGWMPTSQAERIDVSLLAPYSIGVGGRSPFWPWIRGPGFWVSAPGEAQFNAVRGGEGHGGRLPRQHDRRFAGKDGIAYSPPLKQALAQRLRDR